MIRAARSEDAARISAVLVASITGLCAADHHDDPARIARWLADKTPEGVAAMIAAPGGRLYVAGRGRIEAVGAIDWAGQAPDTGKITLLYVDPEARRQGLSAALLAAMEAELMAMGRRNGLLTATATVFAFYRHHGWHAAGPAHEGRWILGHPMCKTLG
ncbi:acetyltransferase (GNAT) family protein [Rhodobacter sp. 140A]|nr:acetyltransferase (GNAT) family protein [Rhodobacter sp. 140A]